MSKHPDFVATKCALFCEGELIVIRRDNIVGIPWPDHWDFPGGGREGIESPWKCIQRETFEELGIVLTLPDVHFTMAYQSPTLEGAQSWFFAAQISPERRDNNIFGNEGQGWAQMSLDDYISHHKAIPFLVKELERYLATSD
ncbi:MAG: NUDIX hydrolase [Pseudomonadota bacterium]